MSRIKVAIAGVGNCCSALIQGVNIYNHGNQCGVIHEKIGSYSISDIEFVTAFDIDDRKVGVELSRAIYSEPNKTPCVTDVPDMGVKVLMGPVLDSFENSGEGLIRFSDEEAVNVSEILKKVDADILVNLISGSALEASKYYAKAAINAGCAFLNATPSLIVNDSLLAESFNDENLPIAGDDLLDQIGATVTHIGLLEFLHSRGVKIHESYQLDVGGGAESVNTLWKTRELKRDIKTSAVGYSIPYSFPLVSGSTDYIDFLGNSRDSFFWFKGSYFSGAPFSLDVKLNTVDAPNAGAVLLDIIRGLKISLDRGKGGPIEPLCVYGFKKPPRRLSLKEAYNCFKEFTK